MLNQKTAKFLEQLHGLMFWPAVGLMIAFAVYEVIEFNWPIVLQYMAVGFFLIFWGLNSLVHTEKFKLILLREGVKDG